MTDLISAVQNVKDPRKSHGAFVRGVQNRMDAVKPHLEMARPEMVASLYHVLADMEQYIALNMANKQERDAIAHEQEKGRKLSDGMKNAGNGAVPNSD